jgi:hypothetical protein
MAIHRGTDADRYTVTFVLVDEDPVGPISVVGSFNDWTPGTHPFEANPDGSRSVTVVLPPEKDVYFRYLGPEGFWFDDPDADEINAEGSVLWASASEISPESASGTEDQPEPHDETGERLEAVTDRINAAKSAAHELVDRDIIAADAID